jgi:hypothetical protein
MRLVTIARYDRPYQAHLAVTLLADADIPAHVAGERDHGLSSIFSPARGGVQLRVPEGLADEARAILEAAETEASDPSQDPT